MPGLQLLQLPASAAPTATRTRLLLLCCTLRRCLALNAAARSHSITPTFAALLLV
jgi:hypothetical protein